LRHEEGDARELAALGVCVLRHHHLAGGSAGRGRSNRTAGETVSSQQQRTKARHSPPVQLTARGSSGFGAWAGWAARASELWPRQSTGRTVRTWACSCFRARFTTARAAADSATHAGRVSIATRGTRLCSSSWVRACGARPERERGRAAGRRGGGAAEAPRRRRTGRWAELVSGRGMSDCPRCGGPWSALRRKSRSALRRASAVDSRGPGSAGAAAVPCSSAQLVASVAFRPCRVPGRSSPCPSRARRSAHRAPGLRRSPGGRGALPALPHAQSQGSRVALTPKADTPSPRRRGAPEEGRDASS